jgi:ribonuclease P protein component
MLKKINRLSNLRIKAKSQKFENPLLSVKIASSDEDETKFGFVVSKKIDQRAVVRNKTKRVLKKAARQLLNKLDKGKNIIVYAKAKVDFTQEKAIEKNLEQVFKKAEIIK